jgi:hypothetical protein
MSVLQFRSSARRAAVAADRLCFDMVERLREIKQTDGESAVAQAAEETLITAAAILGHVAGSDRLSCTLSEIGAIWNL